jgi:predicted  nucleic acid-binding Zn-ribbon protein
VARLTDEIEQLESSFAAAEKEVERLENVIDGLEDEITKRDTTIAETNQFISELEDLVSFVGEHYPDAIKAYEVRQRMEEANGTET